MARLFPSRYGSFDGGVTLLPPESRVGLRQNLTDPQLMDSGSKTGLSCLLCSRDRRSCLESTTGDGRNDSDGLFSTDRL